MFTILNVIRHQKKAPKNTNINENKLKLTQKCSDNKLNFNSWLKRKQKNALEKQKRFEEDNQLRRQNELRRKSLSENLYTAWLKQSALKSKPVPPNQGLLSNNIDN